MPTIDITTLPTATGVRALVSAVDGELPAEGEGDTIAEALAQARGASVAQVARLVRAGGAVLTPGQLVAVELRVGHACALALSQATPTLPRFAPDPLGFGSDVSTFAGPNGDDLDPLLPLLTGYRVVAEAVARRWTTRRGTLAYDLNYGRDVRELLLARVTDALLATWARDLEAEALADERVVACAVTVTASGPPGARVVRVAGKIQTPQGPFAFTLAASALATSLDLLRSTP